MIRPLRFLITLSLALGWLASASVARAAVTGKIEGTVTDKATGKPLAGVTVVASSAQGEQAAFTDDTGYYQLTELLPGEYVVRFYYSDVVVERPGLILAADRTLRVRGEIPTQGAKETTYTITERPPTVDVGSAQVQTQITKDLIDKTPVRGGIENRRQYDAVLALVPTSSFDVNPNFSGAAGNENRFYIDGINTTQLQRGFLGTQLTLEFIQETDVVTAAYNAEYGGATGATVNVVTKSGGNDFHGAAWTYLSPLQLTPPVVAGASEAVATTSKQLYTLDFGMDLGGPIVKDKLFFYVGFAPTYNVSENTRTVRRRVATSLPASSTSGSYPGDQVPGKTSCLSFMASPLLCPTQASQLYVLEDIPGQTANTTFSKNIYNWIAKIDYLPRQDHALSLSYIGSPTTAGGTPGGLGALSTRQYSDLDNIHDVSARLVSKLADRRLQLDVIGGWHYEHYEPSFPTDAGYDPRISYTGTMPLGAFENVADCQIQTIHGVSFNPCPVTGYSLGGFGVGSTFPPQTGDRYSASAGATYFMQAAGNHAIKLGMGMEDNIFENRPYFTGGYQYRVATDGTVSRQAYVDGQMNALPGGAASTTSTLAETIYLRDSWNVRFIPDLTLNYGVRWEGTQLKGPEGQTILSINDSVAPRAGFAYDFTHRGLGRIYGNYGRYYEAIPMTLNDDQFANHNPTKFVGAVPGTCTRDMQTGLIDIGTCQFPSYTAADLQSKSYPVVQPDIKGQYINEVVGGVQLDVGRELVLGASYVHRDLGRLVENASPDGSGNFIVGNPGEDLSDQISDLQRQISATTDPMRQMQLQSLLAQTRALSALPKPRRDYNAFIVTAQKRLSQRFVLLGSYAYSRTVGNWGGMFDSIFGRTPNVSALYDYRYLMANVDGPLPGDRPHNFKFSAGYSKPFLTSTLDLGLSWFVSSGTVINVLGQDPGGSGSNIIFILPRGSGGRLPTVSTLSLHAGFGRQVTDKVYLQLYADVFNALNQQDVTGVNNVYTLDKVSPIPNGRPDDLKNLRTVDGAPARVNPNYGQPTSYQAPLSMRFGVRAQF